MIVIAGGSGNIGRQLATYLRTQGNEVSILSRFKKSNQEFYWNPETQEIDVHFPFDAVEVLINLCGSGIGDRGWSEKRRHELFTSRIIPTQYLVRLSDRMPNLKQVLQISGATCYGKSTGIKHQEEDAFGEGFLSQLTQKWEAAATFSVPTTILRAGVVMYQGGALAKIKKPIALGFGSYIGDGSQIVPWISMHDLVRLFHFALTKPLIGTYHAVTVNQSNASITDELLAMHHKRKWFPNVPKWLLRAILGEMSDLLIESYEVDSQKLLEAGFVPQELCLKDLSC